MSWQRYPGAQLGPPEALRTAETARNGDNHTRAGAPPPDSAYPPHGYQDVAYRQPQAYHPPPTYQDHWMQGPQRQIPAHSIPTRGDWVSLNEPWTREAPAVGYPGSMRGPTRRGTPGFLMATLRLCVFHVVNIFFALIASGVISAGICAAVSLLPMCCVGLLLFQVLVYIVFALAQWDIALSNYIAPAHQCASPRLSPHRGLIGRNSYSGYRIAPGLTYFSPLSLMAMLYFVLVKPVIGSLSLLAVLLVIAPVVSFIASLTSQYHDDYNWIEIYGVSTMTMSRYPGFSLVGAILVALVAIALMQLVSKISLQATRFFCCENFTVTSRFHGGYPYEPIAQHDMGSYGAVSTTT